MENFVNLEYRFGRDGKVNSQHGEVVKQGFEDFVKVEESKQDQTLG